MRQLFRGGVLGLSGLRTWLVRGLVGLVGSAVFLLVVGGAGAVSASSTPRSVTAGL